jgi:small-conductance mechanosensitive channel
MIGMVYFFVNVSSPYAPIILSILVVALGYIIVKEISKILETSFVEKQHKNIVGVINYLVRVAAFFAVLFVILSVFRVNLTGILVAGGFAGIVVGLAAQTVLSNVFAGIAITASDMVKPDEEVTIQGWQWGFGFPFFKPKGLSADRVPSGFTGRVIALKAFYVEIMTDDGNIVKLPNNEFIGAAITSHTRNSVVRDRLQIEVPIKTNILKFKSVLGVALGKVKKAKDLEIHIEEMSIDEYLIKITWGCRNTAEERKQTRDNIITTVSKVIKNRPRLY